ncbi:MAG: replication-associated recombination protein A [Planctomycetes bacterium]|nr:replication-associated recombination protein A [Planctomycetota bacterium]
MADIFASIPEEPQDEHAPLAERMRPRTFADFVGQQKIVGEGALLRKAIESGELPSIILWGPPGSGKTTLARIVATKTKAFFVPFSAVTSGVKELREVISHAEKRRKFERSRTILFVDEIHRWNKSQQDALLPHVESGLITLIGATTENPSFEINSALLSRCRVFVLESLSDDEIVTLLKRAIAVLPSSPARHGHPARELTDETSVPPVLEYLAAMSSGDARVALNALELALKSGGALTRESVSEALQRTHLLYDRAGEEHYNIISALHKSLRGSDPDASLYWLGRMLEAGEEPLYVARRLVRFASEDVGMADPWALNQAVSAFEACHYIGMPECELALAQLVVYLALAPKSNKLYTAYAAVKKDIRELPAEGVPLHLRNAPTKLMKNLGYGKDYKYNPDYDGPVDQTYLPDSVKDRKYWTGET